MNPADLPRITAPANTSRLIPSRFPPVGAFEAVASPEDLEAVMELEGWTNDRLVAPRLKRLPREEWIFGRPNASVVMAAFLHAAPGGQRFSGSDLGAWYAATDLNTAILEVANGLCAEIALSALPHLSQSYRQYLADLRGDFVDVFGTHPALHDPDPASYPVTQNFGEAVRGTVSLSGIRYESVRRLGHENWVCYRPSDVENVRQAAHLRIEVPATGKIVMRRLAG